MGLYEEILENAPADGQEHAIFTEAKTGAAELVEMRSFRALQKIKEIIEDDSLEDDECFMRIEEIVRIFEAIGSGGGARHHFG